MLKEKLDSLLKTLNEESQASPVAHPAPPPTIAEEQETEGITLPPLPHHHSSPHTCPPWASAPPTSAAAAIFKPREQLMLRANSLKKALRQIIEQAEKGTPRPPSRAPRGPLGSPLLLSVVDEQNRHTQVHRMASASCIRRENSEELKEAEPRECEGAARPGGGPLLASV